MTEESTKAWITNNELWDLIAPAIGIHDRPYVTKLTVVIDFDSIPTIEVEEWCKNNIDTSSLSKSVQKFRLVPVDAGVEHPVPADASGRTCTSGSSPWVTSPKSVQDKLAGEPEKTE